MSGRVGEPFSITRGRSLDFGADATGQLVFSVPIGKANGSFARTVLATTGLLGCWPFGEASGTVAADIAGADDGAYMIAPTLGVAGPLTGDTSSAVTVASASTQYVSVPYAAALHPGDTFTLACWVKRTASGHLDPIVSAGTNDFYLTIGADDKVRLTKEGGSDVFVSTAAYTDTNWHRYVVTKSGATTVVYRDGAAIAGTVTDQTITAAAGAVRWGARVSSAVYANASLAYGSLWSRALTADEAAADYAAGTTAPVFPAYDRIGRGETMLGRRVLVLADYLTDTDRPLFSGRTPSSRRIPPRLTSR